MLLSLVAIARYAQLLKVSLDIFTISQKKKKKERDEVDLMQADK